MATITDFGIFVSLEEYDRLQGLVHISQVVKRRVEATELRDMFAPGEDCWVKVLSLDQVEKFVRLCTDAVKEGGKNKLSLSMKFVSQSTGEDLDPNNGISFPSPSLTTQLKQQCLNRDLAPSRPLDPKQAGSNLMLSSRRNVLDVVGKVGQEQNNAGEKEEGPRR